MQQDPVSNYNRPEPPSGGPYQHDKVIGILVMVFNICCGVTGGLALMGLGAALGMAGAGAATAGGAEGAEGAAVAAAGGGMAAIIGGVIVALSLAGAAIGYGIMQSLRWGFSIGMIVFGLNAALNLFSVVTGNFTALVGLAISGLLTYYCWGRLNGKIGSPPSN